MIPETASQEWETVNGGVPLAGQDIRVAERLTPFPMMSSDAPQALAKENMRHCFRRGGLTHSWLRSYNKASCA